MSRRRYDWTKINELVVEALDGRDRSRTQIIDYVTAGMRATDPEFVPLPRTTMFDCLSKLTVKGIIYKYNSAAPLRRRGRRQVYWSLSVDG
jgi:hypothetical protein